MEGNVDDEEVSQGSPDGSQASGLMQAYTTRNKSTNHEARQVAINFMPSRQAAYSNTVKLRRNNSTEAALLNQLLADDGVCQQSDRQAELIVRDLELNQRLMEDDPEAEDLRREALRHLNHNLTMKRTVRAKLSASVSLRSKHRPLSCWKRFKYRIGFAVKRAKDRFRDFIYSIELWYEDIRKIEGNFGSSVGSYFHFLRWLLVSDFLLMMLMVAFVVAPQLVHQARVGQVIDVAGPVPSGILDFISGKGPYENSTLFYGSYHSGSVSGSRYSMPFAYFYTVVCVYIAFFAFMCYRTAYSYAKNFIETEGGVRHVFANKLFSGWDHGIASDRAANLHARNNYNEFKELLADRERRLITVPLCHKIYYFIVNLVITCLVLVCMASIQYGLYSLLKIGDSRWSHWELMVSLLVTLVICAAPVVFNLVGKLEYYAPRTKLYVSLARTFLLDVSTLLMLVFFYSQTTCWETLVGQEMYRLVLLDAVVSLVLFPCLEFFRGFMYKLSPSSTSVPEFAIAYNSLTLLYNQALLWCGVVFSPLLAVAMVVKLFILFYVKKSVALHACVPARRVWRAAQTQTVMYVLVTVSMFIMAFTLGSLFIKSTSQTCGPFTQYAAVYTVLTEGTLNLSQNTTLKNILSWLVRPGAIGMLLMFLCTAVYYVNARAKAHRSMVSILRRMLEMQAKDKDFLLCAIDKVSNGEWLYTPRDEKEPNSNTWKYLNDENVRKPSNAGFHLDGSRVHQSALDNSRLNQSTSFDNSRLRAHANHRPQSMFRDDLKCVKDEGESDSSFSWKGSGGNIGMIEDGGKKWI